MDKKTWLKEHFGHTIHGSSCKTCEDMYDDAFNEGFETALKEHGITVIPKDEKKTIWCNCGDATKNTDGICDTCKLSNDEMNKKVI